MNKQGILIVDDEKSAIQAVLQGVEWSRLPDFQIFTAENIKEAEECMERNHIRILLCDIEMPMGSGLDLLEWVKLHYPETVSVLMTCHAEFSYAQRAVHLGSFDYILKPLDFAKLTEILVNASQKAVVNEESQKARTYMEIGKKAVKEQFWRKYYIGDITADNMSLSKYIQKNNLDIRMEDTFVPVLISGKGVKKLRFADDRKLLGFALRNIANEVFEMEIASHEMESISEDLTLVILTVHKNVDNKKIRECCRKSCTVLIDVADQYLKIPVCCYIGKSVDILGVPQQIETLQRMDINNLTAYRLTLFAGDEYQWENEYKYYDLLRELERKCDGSYVKMLDQIAKEVESNKLHCVFDKEYLLQFSIGFYIIMESFCRRNNFLLGEIIDEDQNWKLAEKASQSPEALAEWVRFIKNSIQQFEREGVYPESPVEQVRRFVAEHLEEVTVEMIARHVHLNPDYLNRIFKKETGMALSRFLISQKMDRAKWLLAHTDWSIGDVAASVGYYNYSSFTRIFNKYEGTSPQEYKRQVTIG